MATSPVAQPQGSAWHPPRPAEVIPLFIGPTKCLFTGYHWGVTRQALHLLLRWCQAHARAAGQGTRSATSGATAGDGKAPPSAAPQHHGNVPQEVRDGALAAIRQQPFRFSDRTRGQHLCRAGLETLKSRNAQYIYPVPCRFSGLNE